jgi:hypothetical protein
LVCATDHIDTEPALDSPTHIGGDLTEVFLPIPIVIPPLNADESSLGAWLDDASADKAVQIELKAILQLYAL